MNTNWNTQGNFIKRFEETEDKSKRAKMLKKIQRKYKMINLTLNGICYINEGEIVDKYRQGQTKKG